MLTTGVDIVQINRIEKILDTKRDRFYERIFTKKEIKYIEKRQNVKTIAGLFAAKEAISKALGTGIGKIGWQDIEITHSERGEPLVHMLSKLKEELVKQNLNSIEISISHEKEYAIAFAICFNNSHFK